LHRDLRGRRALITGSSGGLGAAMAHALAGAGANVMLTGLEPARAVEGLRELIARTHGVQVDYCSADLRRPAGVESLVTTARLRLGGIDILVNNAVVRHFAPIEAFPVERWDEALAVNVSAAFHAIRLLLPDMRAAGYGRIINMTSVYGSRGTANRVDYVTSKAAIQGLTRAVAMETLDADVTCHALCPASVLTPANERRIETIMMEERLPRSAAESRFLVGKQPNGRFVDPDTVAQVLLLLCGPAGRDMNGAIVPIDAGWLSS
jgi:3-hydroxybutyrate dehydrogenase